MPDPRRILFVVDDVHVRRLISAFFDAHVDVADVVATEDAAIALLEEARYDAMVLDLRRGVDGSATVVRRLRHDWSNDELPILVIVGRWTALTLRALQLAGADECLARPYSLSALADALALVIAPPALPTAEQVVPRYATPLEGSVLARPPLARLGRLTVAQRHIIESQHRLSHGSRVSEPERVE
jgi:DNA-binding response OmpR family regulator